jgi:hypothetical protein
MGRAGRQGLEAQGLGESGDYAPDRVSGPGDLGNLTEANQALARLAGRSARSILESEERQVGHDEIHGRRNGESGFLLEPRGLGAEVIPAEGGTLPGAPGTVYNRIPWPVLLVVAPAMGGAFAMFLPFLGLAMLAKYAFGLATGRRAVRHTEA